MSRALQRRDAAYSRDSAFGPSMTPMVDVVLVILIFFMASTTFLGPEWLLRTALPRASEATVPGATGFALPPARFDLILTVDGHGATSVSGLGLDGVSVGEAAERIGEYAARLGPDRLAIFIDPAPAVPYRDVVRLHEACAAAGIGNIGLR